MIRIIDFDIDDIKISAETESLKTRTPVRMSDYDAEIFPGVSVTSDEAAPQIKTKSDPLMQQLTHLWKLMRELRKEQSSRHHEETAPFRAASSTSSSGSLSDNENPNNLLLDSIDSKVQFS